MTWVPISECRMHIVTHLGNWCIVLERGCSTTQWTPKLVANSSKIQTFEVSDDKSSNTCNLARPTHGCVVYVGLADYAYIKLTTIIWALGSNVMGVWVVPHAKYRKHQSSHTDPVHHHVCIMRTIRTVAHPTDDNAWGTVIWIREYVIDTSTFDRLLEYIKL